MKSKNLVLALAALMLLGACGLITPGDEASRPDPSPTLVRETSTRLTWQEAEIRILAFLQDRHPDLNPDLALAPEELPSEEVWELLGAQVFRLTAGPQAGQTFLFKENQVVPLGEAFGGPGLTSLEVADLDGDGRAELLYAYSFGSGFRQSRLGMYAPAYDPARTFEADFAFGGLLALKREEGGHIAVRMIELEPDRLLIRYLDRLGTLGLEAQAREPVLVINLAPDLPVEVQEKILP